jgi:hypothetical protein
MTMAKPLSAARTLLVAASALTYVALLETGLAGSGRIRLVRVFSASAWSVTLGERVGWAA